MIRIPRICLVLGLSFVLLDATVPAAHARTLSKPQSSNSIIGSWIDATLAWVVNLVTGAPHGQAAAHGTKVYTSGSGYGSGGAVPMVGSGIDPSGTCTYGCGTP
jgi:hypothetical protein